MRIVMQRFLKIAIPVFLGSFLGLGLILLHISSNGTLQKHIVQKLQNDFEKKYQCSLDCQLDWIDWLSLKMHFSNVSIKPLLSNDLRSKESWSIVADNFILSASWFMLFTRFQVKICGAFDHMIMYEKQECRNSKLMLFLSTLFKPGDSGLLMYDWMSINDGLIFIDDTDDEISVRIPFSCNISCEKVGTRMQFYPQDGKIFFQEILMIDEISGTFILDIPSKDIIKGMNAQINIGLHVPFFMKNGKCSLVGGINHGFATFALCNEDNSFVVDPIQIRIDSKKCLLDMSILANSNIFTKINMNDFVKEISGAVKVNVRGDLYDLLNSLQIDVVADNLLYKSKKIIQDAKFLVHYIKPGVLSGLFEIDNKQYCEFIITIGQDFINATCFNNQDFILPVDSNWKVPAKQFSIDISYDKILGLNGSYKFICNNDKLEKQKKIVGTCLLKEQTLSLSGNLDEILYDIAIKVVPDFAIEKAMFIKDGKEIVDFHTDKNDASLLLGNIDFFCINNLVSDQFNASFSQEGSVQFKGFLKNGVYYGQVSTRQANIRIPKIYNVVQNVLASCELDFYNRSISLKDVKIELHEGDIICSEANLFFDKSGTCQFMHLPCLLHNVLMSWDKGIFMLLSGSILMRKLSGGQTSMIGQVIVEKSQLKDNIFSSEFQEQLFGKVFEYKDKDSSENSCNLDIAIFTKDLLNVKTSTLEALAKIDLLLKGTIKKPELSGLIQLVSGSFYFPYKSLDIIDGKLFFLPDQQFDPLLEVVAKGKLKRFGIFMHVTGSVFDPVVQFEATPYLTEDQIVSLLLLGIESGTEENSLSIMAPALLTQKLKDLIFGPALSKTKMLSKFERLLQSLKYFRFLPQFTNQTGRGGIRGVFEVEASDHLQGKIDINFMQPEDTKFEADFALTDDITIKAQKDGPSTYGGEVEFRWKFGQ